MSDFEDDIGEQLLELAGATERKKKKRQGSGGASGGGGGTGGAKKRKAEYVMPFSLCIFSYSTFHYGFWTAWSIPIEKILFLGLV